MTRDEAVTAIHKAHHPEDHGYSSVKSISNRHWAEKAVDGYVALGMLKLDEPKGTGVSEDEITQRLLGACRGVPYLATSINETLAKAGLKIVSK